MVEIATWILVTYFILGALIFLFIELFVVEEEHGWKRFDSVTRFYVTVVLWPIVIFAWR